MAYAGVDSPFGHLTAAVTDAGIVRLAFEGEELDDVLQELADRVSPRVLEAPARLDGVRRELDEYFEGHRHEFSTPVDWRLSHGFHLRAREACYAIPFGERADLRRAGGGRGEPARPSARPGRRWRGTPCRSSSPATACCARAAAWAATAAGST